MNIAFQEGMRLSEKLAGYVYESMACHSTHLIPLTEDNDGSGTVADLLVLRSTELDHVLCGRMCDLDFAQDCVSVVCQSGFGVVSNYDNVVCKKK